MKVSVVVPVYNPGGYLDPCIRSLLGQSLDPADYEIILVDDGSTDDSPARLDALAKEHARIRVFHEENSGWPGRPRNVGADAARGEYVQFVDQDDELAPEALERMYAIGSRNHSDVVLGKVGGTMQAPSNVFASNIESCTVDDSLVMESLTPHKMFRRDFLREQDVRFPEGKRRLEDQLFMAKAYLRAKAISVVGDYVCYYWMRRDDGGNNSSGYTAPEDYFANLREVIELVVTETEPGPRRDHLLRRFFRVEMMTRMREPRLLRYSDRYRQQSYAEIRKLAQEYFAHPSGVVEGLAPTMRLRAHLLEQDRLESLVALARRQQGDVCGVTSVHRAEVRSGRLIVELSAEIQHRDGTPIVVVARGDRYLLDPKFTAEISGVPDEGWDVGDPLAHAELEFRVHDRAAQTAWFPSTDVMPVLERVEGDDRFKVVLRTRASIDPRELSAAGLAPGGYEVTVGFQALGHGLGSRPIGPNGPLTLDVDRLGRAASAPLLTRIRPVTARILASRRVRGGMRRILGLMPQRLVRPVRRLAGKLR